MVYPGWINLNLWKRIGTLNILSPSVPSLWPTPLTMRSFLIPPSRAVWQRPRDNGDHFISKTAFDLVFCLYHLSSCASNTLHWRRLLWKQNTHTWYRCVHFSYVLAWIMVLLIFMKFEKINILDYFLCMEMLWFQTPEKTIGKFCKLTFSACQLESRASLAEVTTALTLWASQNRWLGACVKQRGKKSADVHI